MRISMRSIVFVIALLVLGFVLTVGVSWLAVVVSTYNHDYKTEVYQSVSDETWDIKRSFGSEIVTPSLAKSLEEGSFSWLRKYDPSDYYSKHPLPSWSKARLYTQQDFDTLGTDGMPISEGAHGFPFKSFMWWIEAYNSGKIEVRCGIPFNWPPGAMRSLDKKPILPFKPIWGGLIFNTLFYALVYILIRKIIKLKIRNYRTRGNRCTNCGYSLNGLEDKYCPECGSAGGTGE